MTHGTVASCILIATVGEPSEPLIQVLGRGPGYLFAAHRNVLIAHWTAQGTGALIAAFGEALAAFVPQHPERFSNINLIAAGLPLANSEARDALGALMKVHDGAMACVGTVLDGTGFWASATRGLIMSLQLMAPSSFATRTCANDAEVVEWIIKPHAGRTGVVLERQSLTRALVEVRGLSSVM